MQSMNLKEFGVALFWLVILGLAVIAGGQVMDKVRSSVNKAL